MTIQLLKKNNGIDGEIGEYKKNLRKHRLIIFARWVGVFAVLFIGIFITMQPALMLLKALGPHIGLSSPREMFWATGALSSFLDNTPTYLVFLTTAGTLGFLNGVTTSLGTVPVKLLSAISCGAVFMGANTYIGNAPNFMVKSISDENGVNMPSFFGYIGWSLVFLVPVFILDMLVFFM